MKFTTKLSDIKFKNSLGLIGQGNYIPASTIARNRSYTAFDTTSQVNRSLLKSLEVSSLINPKEKIRALEESMNPDISANERGYSETPSVKVIMPSGKKIRLGSPKMRGA